MPSVSAKTMKPDLLFPKGQICHSHQVDGFILVGPQKSKDTKLPNGDEVVTTHGALVIKFVNHHTRKALIEDVSGRTKTVTHPDGTVDETATGRNWWALGPGGQRNTGRPGLFITTGPVALHVIPPTVQSFAQKGGTTLDLCKALHAA
jgi:hypothetical protein